VRSGRIVQINVSPGGVPKLPVETARVTEMGIEGDGQRDTKNHGGPDNPQVESKGGDG
jgi:MOSC domain-containing protein YiiM